MPTERVTQIQTRGRRLRRSEVSVGRRSISFYIILGEAKHVVQGILTVAGMFAQHRRNDNLLKKFEAWLDAVWWPGDAGHVPKGVCLHVSLMCSCDVLTFVLQLLTAGMGKADQWRNMVSVLPVGLYEAWQVNGDIPDREAPLLRQSQKTAIKAKRVSELVRERRQTAAAHNPSTTVADLEYIAQESMHRNYRDHYATVIEWAVAIRIWASQSISVEEARRAQDCHDCACQDWARMFCHLTPYFHIMIHFLVFVLCLGPVYAWWAYIYEHFNGWLSKINHNGHKGGEQEATLMRSWTKLHLMHDLVCDLSLLHGHDSLSFLTNRSSDLKALVMRRARRMMTVPGI